MELYRLNDYRAAIRWAIDRERSRGHTLTLASLAAHARVQPPYLSKVLGGTANFSVDQLFLISKNLGLSEAEQSFIRLLHDYGTSQVPERRTALRERIELLREAKSQPAEQRRAEKLVTQPEDSAAYYLNPQAQILHMHLTIERWRKNPERLAEALRLALPDFWKLIELLERLGLVERKGQAIKIVRDHVHLERNSGLTAPNHALMRAAALGRAGTSSRSYAFTATFSANEAARREISEAFADFLKRVDGVVRDAPSDEVYQINFDLFPWL